MTFSRDYQKVYAVKSQCLTIYIINVTLYKITRLTPFNRCLDVNSR